jgi:hypothetical protein
MIDDTIKSVLESQDMEGYYEDDPNNEDDVESNDDIEIDEEGFVDDDERDDQADGDW